MCNVYLCINRYIYIEIYFTGSGEDRVITHDAHRQLRARIKYATPVTYILSVVTYTLSSHIYCSCQTPSPCLQRKTFRFLELSSKKLLDHLRALYMVRDIPSYHYTYPPSEWEQHLIRDPDALCYIMMGAHKEHWMRFYWSRSLHTDSFLMTDTVG